MRVFGIYSSRASEKKAVIKKGREQFSVYFGETELQILKANLLHCFYGGIGKKTIETLMKIMHILSFTLNTNAVSQNELYVLFDETLKSRKFLMLFKDSCYI